MSSQVVNYFNDPLHHSLRSHYTEADYGGAVVLVFSEAWRKAWLPKDLDLGEQLLVVLVDTEGGGKEYGASFACSVDGPHPAWVMDVDWNEPHLCHLQGYFYGGYYCQCKREGELDLEDGLGEDECGGERFKVKKIVSPRNPGLILYSETMGVDELEDRLRKEDGRCETSSRK